MDEFIHGRPARSRGGTTPGLPREPQDRKRQHHARQIRGVCASSVRGCHGSQTMRSISPTSSQKERASSPYGACGMPSLRAHAAAAWPTISAARKKQRAYPPVVRTQTPSVLEFKRLRRSIAPSSSSLPWTLLRTFCQADHAPGAQSGSSLCDQALIGQHCCSPRPSTCRCALKLTKSPHARYARMVVDTVQNTRHDNNSSVA